MNNRENFELIKEKEDSLEKEIELKNLLRDVSKNDINLCEEIKTEIMKVQKNDKNRNYKVIERDITNEVKAIINYE